MKRFFMFTIVFLLGGQVFAKPATKEYTRKTFNIPAKKTEAEITKALANTAPSKNRGMAKSIDAIRKAVAQNSAKIRATKKTAAVPAISAFTQAKAAPARKA